MCHAETSEEVDKVSHLVLDFRFHRSELDGCRLTAAGHMTLGGLETSLRLAPALGESAGLMTSPPLQGWGQPRPCPQERGRSGHPALGAGDLPSCHQLLCLLHHQPDQGPARREPPLMAGDALPTGQQKSALPWRCASSLVVVSQEAPSDSYSGEENSKSSSPATKSRWGWSAGPADTTSPSLVSKDNIQELSGKDYMQQEPRDNMHQGQVKELRDPNMDPTTARESAPP